MNETKTIGLIWPESCWHENSKELRGRKVQVKGQTSMSYAPGWSRVDVTFLDSPSPRFYEGDKLCIAGIRFLEDKS